MDYRPPKGATAGLSSSVSWGHCWTSQQWHPFQNTFLQTASRECTYRGALRHGYLGCFSRKPLQLAEVLQVFMFPCFPILLFSPFPYAPGERGRSQPALIHAAPVPIICHALYQTLFT